MEEVLKSVGRYDVLEVVGRGGAAVVYLAFQRDLERHVALKELAPQHAESDFAGRFVDESRLAASMSHPNVVTVHEFFEDNGVPYIAMEYLPQGSLRQYVGRLSTAQLAGVLEGVLAGLSHGEAHGIVHRDLKPENLLVAGDGRVKIADFGVARAYNRATRAVVTVAGTTIGTPAYMSPEQALGGPLTAATDLYSLGVVTWELLTGEVPFEENDTPVAVLYRHVHEPIPPVRSVAPDVDEGISAWLERMLAKRPEDRFESADAAWLELEDVVLELLGPRWRRSARLVLEDAGASAPRTLTPAAFAREAEAGAGAEVAVGGEAEAPTPVEETHGELPAESPRTTIAPTRGPRRSYTTMLRIARRHRDDAEGAREPASDALRRRGVVAAIVAAMAVAAVVGIVLAQPGGRGSATSTTSAAAARAAAVATANRQLQSIVSSLAAARSRGLATLRGGPSAGQQAAGAAAVQQAYAAAARRVAPLAGASPLADPLERTLTSTAAAYGRLGAAAKAGDSRAWSKAGAAIDADEQRLQSQVAKL